MEEGAWSDESHSWTAGCMCIAYLDIRCTTGRKQASGGSVGSVPAVETLGPALNVDVTLKHTTYINSLMETVIPDGIGLFQQDRSSRC